MKTVLILVDGMRPDAMVQMPFAKELLEKSTYALDASTVFPSVTLPCHMSLFHSVEPGRHGTTTNTYMPQVRPVDGICEVLSRNDKYCGVFYNWEEIRDLTRPGSLKYSYLCRMGEFGYDVTNDLVTEAAMKHLKEKHIDFTFLYLGYTDWAGHVYGWMTDEYMKAMENSWKNIKLLLESLDEDYNVIITADHGGHDRTHGTDLPEDMTIPIICYGKSFEAGKVLTDANIMDIAPTITELAGIAPAAEWEGKSLLS